MQTKNAGIGTGKMGRGRVQTWGIIALLTLALVLSGCGGSEAEPTPTPTKTPVTAAAEAATPVPPTAAPVEAAPVAPAEAVAPAAAAPVSIRATVNADQLNVRSGPGGSFEVVRSVTLGQQFDVTGKSADGQWLELAENGTVVGFSAAQYFDLDGDLASIPVAGSGTAQSTNQQTTQSTSSQAPQTGSGTYLPATMSSPDFGAQAFLWWRAELADRDLKLMNEAGFNWVKQALAWETIEGGGKGQFDWTIADRMVRQVNTDGLKLLARVSSDPDLGNFWAGHPPQNGDNYADFVFALASRYNCSATAVGCIQAYQIWNEPNLAREWGNNRPNPAQYAEFLGKAYRAIKRANPNAIVISAGMAPTGDDSNIAMPDDKFYDQMYQAMGGNSNGYFDMLGVHGAGFAAPPELDPAEAAANPKYGGYRFFAFRHIEDIRAIMVKYGDSAKKVVVLEFGWTYDSVNPAYAWHGAGAGIDEFTQSEYLKRAYEYAAANWRPWIGLMSLLTMPNVDWLNDGNPQDEEQYWWAIMEPSQINELKFRRAFVLLCIYFNGTEGQRCVYDPN
ncbi:MAG: SH3 domain-containing protein [Caldilineaceae bacterium]|nr:SH3 domain-containing protein [Caldilineaceae bacterium]MBP8109457.1 SH3 domain-containing protein [Caldilineaceae bacterium]MBP8123653.1 SH3 domain-containing protein [Caldilineaceae bacterium]MBP9073093.1 SH3 domain-containing protein [Caldilineaceae bacterium]